MVRDIDTGIALTCIEIGFWRIPMEDNTLADGLAKAAAVSGDVALK